jgi:excisionase family DNA binding protein
MIDIACEKLLTLQQAADLMPVSRGGSKVHFVTIWRWIRDRKLEGIRVGGRWLTSLEAIQRAAERETLRALGELPAPEMPVQTTGRKRALARAEREAEAIGI